MSENATVNISNISPKTTEKEIRDFFSFCGKIEDLSITPTTGEAGAPLSATVTFAQASAARTALLLDNTQLSGAPIHVSAPASLSDLQHDAEAHNHEATEEEIRQEDKPRAAIFAEYLAHGYVVGDKALQKGIELDEKHGISSRFTKFVNDLNNKHKVADKTRAMDSTYGITTKANTGYSTAQRYLESALNTPTGQRVRAFYEKGSKQIFDIHSEARRLADLKAAEAHKCTCESAGPEGQCNCAPGSCSCTGCKAKTAAAASSSSEKPAPEYTPMASTASTSEKVTYQ